MPEHAFVPLACHSFYSLLWGTASPEALCRRAGENGAPALALTDRAGLYGALPFWEAAQRTGVRPILGALVPASPGPARLLAADARGWRRLARILTRFHQENRRGTTFPLLDLLREDRRGLVVLSASVPLLDALVRDSGPEDIWVSLYPFGPQRALLRYSRRAGVPVAATAPVYFLQPEDHAFHRVLRAIGLRCKLDRVPDSEQAPPWAWFQGGEAWRARYLHCPEALAGMQRVAERCAMRRPPWGEWVFPPFEDLTGPQAFARLEAAARRGAAVRCGSPPARPVLERLDHELGIIREKGLASYFLVVQDIVQRFPVTCGRGSAAASLVAYSLGITHVDPLAHDLFFERFLNRGRADPPDMDVDFPWDERDAVLSYVLERYGPERCAMVANHVGFRARAALREVARVYGIPEEEIREVSEGFTRTGDPFDPDLGQDRKNRHPARGRPPGAPRPPWSEVLGWARRLEGVPRHLSVHCGGVVITPDPLPERVPVEQAAKGVPVIQWEKDAAEDAGLVKIDLLGNRSLAVIRDTLSALRARGETRLSYADLNPLEDAKTRGMLARGDTVGVFYVESPAMRQLLQKTGKGDYAHLVVQSSIIRPAANEFIREYVRRVRGAPYRPLHPLLGEILRETHGILCFQEDVSRVAMALAGFDAAEADRLRKVLSKKDRQARLADFRERFTAGARTRGVPPGIIEEVWRMVLSFQGYSFCKPHSASYALVSFKSCYLKAHHPAEFMAAVISNRGGYYTTQAYLSEARRMNLAILPPDVNRSEWAYTGRGSGIRVGLMQLRGVRRASLEALLEERRHRGPFGSLSELLARVDADPADLKILVKAGCADSIAQGRSRPEMLWELLAWEAGRGTRDKGAGLREGSAAAARLPGARPGNTAPGRTEAPPGQARTAHANQQTAGRRGNPHQATTLEGLWSPGTDPAGDALSGGFRPPRALPYGPDLCLQHELETLGILVSTHPLQRYRPLVRRLGPVPARDLPRHVGRRVTTVGWFVTAKTVLTRRDEPMEFASFEDETALYETTFFPRVLERFRRLPGHSRPYVLQGRVEEEFGAVSLNVEDVRLLDGAR